MLPNPVPRDLPFARHWLQLNRPMTLCEAFRLEFEGSAFKCERKLIQEAFHLNRSGKMLVTIIDDAHLMELDNLRKLRLLLEDFPKNHNLILIRNDLPMKWTIVRLGCHGPISKQSDGYFRFQRPRCGELRATVNPRNNLAHCFSCGTNFNNIDLLLILGHDFLPAVGILTGWLEEYRTDLGRSKSSAHPAAS